ncbi:MAG: rRNA maturation RNase YbeY [Meiothermus sp.]|uniref:rRNA maturation RNase YbeY n=1 Tax=Meiothermus sp. TaxID=1955249 RepID=UPI0025E8CDA0|nr:rRNA maturation RNase YbeY [Meiothermus sp.]MCS7059484.1 rRNA maturation RNase YbeY [Meiothermus sp.]MCS7194011.1 rRNA maturation RNase YbeY [Meiothermus sp.]MDW8090219.1 rRNA maturation RNase YbeY [Meiothermus sp.]MDW8481187.1 rRNA maturation RNase YbeY [Meiothermus sp.]
MATVALVAHVRLPRGIRSKLRRVLQQLMVELGQGDKALTLVLTDDTEVRALKKAHWGEDIPTDVLSFPSYEPGDPFVPPHLGDIVISLETAQRQAEALGHSLEEELRVLAAHALWHLLGHDHRSETEWAGFHRVQARALEI